MKSSSFLFGALVGMTAAVWASQRKSGWMYTMMNQAGAAMKIPGLSGTQSNGKTSSKASGTSGKSGAASSAQVYPSSNSSNSSSEPHHSKEYNLKQITDFIKSSPEVRREVEAILKESHTVIPGL